MFEDFKQFVNLFSRLRFYVVLLVYPYICVFHLRWSYFIWE